MKLVKLILAIVLAVLLVILVLQNTEMVTVDILIRPVTMPLAGMLFFTLLVGFVLGFVATGWLVRKSQKKQREPETAEVASLRDGKPNEP